MGFFELLGMDDANEQERGESGNESQAPGFDKHCHPLMNTAGSVPASNLFKANILPT